MGNEKLSDLQSIKNTNSHLFLRIAHEIDLQQNKLYESYGITGKQSGILTFLLLSADRELTQKDFEKEFNLRSSTINSVLNYLEEGGFITRSVSQTDGRAKIITATEKSRKLLNVILDTKSLQESIVTKGFTENEQAELHRFLLRIIKNFTDHWEGAL